MQWPHTDSDMNWVLRAAAKNKRKDGSDQYAGCCQMQKYGLLDDMAASQHSVSTEPRQHIVRPNFREHISYTAQSAPTTPPPQASVTLEDGTEIEIRADSPAREESMEEQMLRRRRREAMVLEDEGRPLSSANIIERIAPEDSLEADRLLRVNLRRRQSLNEHLRSSEAVREILREAQRGELVPENYAPRESRIHDSTHSR